MDEARQSGIGRSSSRRPRVTIQDVAREAGVSTAAVSKVLRDAYGVSPQMRERVMTAVTSTNYRPHVGARAMRGKSYTIGVVLVDFSSQFQPEIVDGISRELDSGPYQEVLIPAGRDGHRQMKSVEALLDRQVDGLIIIAPQVETTWLENLGRRIPLVVVARHGGAEHFDTVVDDDLHGAQMMVDHLVELGHRSIVHTSQPAEGLAAPHVLSQTARRDGYVRAMKHHGLEPQVVETSYTEEGGYQATLQALYVDPRPTAIFAGADIAALGAMRAAEEIGLDVPAQLSVSGYDNTFLSGVGRISLTTVDQSGPLTGAVSARLLLERIEGRAYATHEVITPRLIVRSTTSSLS